MESIDIECHFLEDKERNSHNSRKESMMHYDRGGIAHEIDVVADLRVYLDSLREFGKPFSVFDQEHPMAGFVRNVLIDHVNKFLVGGWPNTEDGGQLEFIDTDAGHLTSGEYHSNVKELSHLWCAALQGAFPDLPLDKANDVVRRSLDPQTYSEIAQFAHGEIKEITDLMEEQIDCPSVREKIAGLVESALANLEMIQDTIRPSEEEKSGMNTFISILLEGLYQGSQD